ncbi:PA2778 family cysteine peptidase [Motiliproteus sediminis]|uniref:PA2778 family cysteine peptidase n=1 Tax=Motiliproteus sediminis TaxID=1468178 RepID=UPI001AEF77F5|nr:PA2778 family cysteine peptidase [Motiliproteus sediminis]
MNRLWLAALLAAMLTGCTSAPQTTQLRESGLLDQPSSLVSGVPFYPQTTDQCGPAALAAVLNFRQIDTNPEQLRQSVYLAQRGGSLQSDLIAATRAAGLQPFPLPPELGALLQELAAGNPVLVLQNLGLDMLPRWHYAVAVGYDREQQAIILHSGENRALRRPLALFEQSWSRAQRWALVVTSPTQPPATATAKSWLRATLQLEQVGQLSSAQQGYRSLTTQWPEFVDGWIARANADYSAGSPALALSHYQQALRLDLANTSAWNNQAYALERIGCDGQAIASLHCGLRYDPSDARLLDSLNELGNASKPVSQPQADNCPIILCP